MVAQLKRYTKKWFARIRSSRCNWCGKRRDPLSSRRLCTLHNRMAAMQVSARNNNKKVPTLAELSAMWARCGGRCEACRAKLNLRKINNLDAGNRRRQRLTLQHDWSGELKFLCTSCNCAHGQYNTDAEFYSRFAVSK